MPLFTVGIWTVKTGREAEFVDAWTAMGTQTLQEFPGAHGTLLRHHEQPGRFVSFGPWQSIDEIRAWRSSAAFQDGVRSMEELLDAFEPGVYELVTEARADQPNP